MDYIDLIQNTIDYIDDNLSDIPAFWDQCNIEGKALRSIYLKNDFQIPAMKLMIRS